MCLCVNVDENVHVHACTCMDSNEYNIKVHILVNVCRPKEVHVHPTIDRHNGSRSE